MFNIIRMTILTSTSIITTSENMTKLSLTTITIIPINHKLLHPNPNQRLILQFYPKEIHEDGVQIINFEGGSKERKNS